MVEQAPTAGEDGTRERILVAARTEFIENGLRGARMQEIADRAGVNKALLHYHFRDKESLYRAALETVTERMKRDVFGSFTPPGESRSPEEAIRELVATYVRTLHQHPDMVGMLVRELADGGQHLDAVLAGMAPLVREVLGGIDRAIRERSGGEPAVESLHVLMGIFSMAWGVFMLRPVYTRILAAAGVAIDFDEAFLAARAKAIADMALLSSVPREARP